MNATDVLSITEDVIKERISKLTLEQCQSTMLTWFKLMQTQHKKIMKQDVALTTMSDQILSMQSIMQKQTNTINEQDDIIAKLSFGNCVCIAMGHNEQNKA